jgi:putative permease
MNTEKHDFKHTISRFIFFGGIFFLLFLFVKKISTVLIPFVLSFIIAYAFAPFVSKMQYRLKLGRNFSAGLIVILIYIIFIFILTIGTPILYNQAISLIKVLPTVIGFVEGKFLPLIPDSIAILYAETSKNINFDNIINSIFSFDKKDLFSKAYSSGIVIVNIFSTFFLVPILTFYILRDWNKIHKSTLNIIPIHYKREFEKIIHEIRRKVSAYIVGEFYAIFILSVLYGVGLTFTGLKFGFFIGVLTAVFSIIPYVGFAICFISAMLIAFATNVTTLEIVAIISVFLAVQTVESNYIIPKFVGGKIGLHPMWIIFGLLAGGSLLGFIGLLLAIPITTVISVLIRHYIDKYKHSEYYED